MGDMAIRMFCTKNLLAILAILPLGITLTGCSQQATQPSAPPTDVTLEAGADGTITIARSAALQNLQPVVEKLIKTGTIKQLHLYDCDFENGSLAGLAKVDSLEMLELRRATRLGTNSVPQTPFKNLQFVRFERMECTAENLQFLTQAPQLKRLMICYSQIDRATVEQIVRISSIEDVNLHHSFWKPKDWEAIEGANWRSLILDDVSAESGLLRSLATLPRLEKLSLVRSDIREGWEQLKGLSACKWLDLTGCAIDDTAALQLQDLANLEVLQLHQTKVSQDAMKTLQTKLPNCKILDDLSTQTDYSRKSLSNL